MYMYVVMYMDRIHACTLYVAHCTSTKVPRGYIVKPITNNHNNTRTDRVQWSDKYCHVHYMLAGLSTSDLVQPGSE